MIVVTHSIKRITYKSKINCAGAMDERSADTSASEAEVSGSGSSSGVSGSGPEVSGSGFGGSSEAGRADSEVMEPQVPSCNSNTEVSEVSGSDAAGSSSGSKTRQTDEISASDTEMEISNSNVPKSDAEVSGSDAGLNVDSALDAAESAADSQGPRAEPAAEGDSSKRRESCGFEANLSQEEEVGGTMPAVSSQSVAAAVPGSASAAAAADDTERVSQSHDAAVSGDHCDVDSGHSNVSSASANVSADGVVRSVQPDADSCQSSKQEGTADSSTEQCGTDSADTSSA